MFGLKKKKLDLSSPVDGKLIKLAQVPDEVFSQGLMGQGFAIEPTADMIYAPVAGKITNIFPTKHAIGIKTKQGPELLLHLGLDTVELNGTPFELLVTEGQNVDPQTRLCKMDRQQIITAGKATAVLVLVTSGETVTLLEQESEQHGQVCATIKLD